jgi:hypothetical protein
MEILDVRGQFAGNDASSVLARDGASATAGTPRGPGVIESAYANEAQSPFAGKDQQMPVARSAASFLAQTRNPDRPGYQAY